MKGSRNSGSAAASSSVHQADPQVVELWNRFMENVPAKYRDKDGFKAQTAAGITLVMIFAAQGSKVTYEPTPVKGWEDHVGIDGYLVMPSGEKYALDFSLMSLRDERKRDSSKWLVHLKREWFDVTKEGIWMLRKEFLNTFMRSFKAALATGPFVMLAGNNRRN